jgi:hypothetical protein
MLKMCTEVKALDGREQLRSHHGCFIPEQMNPSISLKGGRVRLIADLDVVVSRKSLPMLGAKPQLPSP